MHRIYRRSIFSLHSDWIQPLETTNHRIFEALGIVEDESSYQPVEPSLASGDLRVQRQQMRLIRFFPLFSESREFCDCPTGNRFNSIFQTPDSAMPFKIVGSEGRIKGTVQFWLRESIGCSEGSERFIQSLRLHDVSSLQRKINHHSNTTDRSIPENSDASFSSESARFGSVWNVGLSLRSNCELYQVIGVSENSTNGVPH